MKLLKSLKNNPSRILVLFLVGWVVVNMVQAWFTNIIGDEAYYWYYSHHLQFGYFDHPPLVAVLIRISSVLFHSNLAIRFGTVLLSSATIYLIWLLVPQNNRQSTNGVKLFIALVLVTPALHIYSFITTPDVPLLFCLALYFHAFIRFKNNKNWLDAVWLGLASGLIGYAKYHGAIFILISLLVVPSLLRDIRLYVSGLIALVLLGPHLYWQWEHDWVSLDFHLLNRTSRDYKWFFPLNYLGGLIAMSGPFTIIMLLFMLAGKKISFIEKNSKNRTQLFYVKFFIVTTLFFFLCSFFMRIEAHWVAGACIPLILVVHKPCLELLKKNRKIIIAGLHIMFWTIVTGRILLVLPIPVETEFHDPLYSEKHFKEIRSYGKGYSKVFIDSYRMASLYWFYTQEPAYTLTTHFYRKSQFELDRSFESWHGKEVLLLSNWRSSELYSEVNLGSETKIFPSVYSNFQVIGNLNCKKPLLPYKIKNNHWYDLNMKVFNPYSYPLYAGLDGELQLLLLFRKAEHNFYAPVYLNEKFEMMPGSEKEIVGGIKPENIPPGKYDVLVLAGQAGIIPQEISAPFKMEIVKE